MGRLKDAYDKQREYAKKEYLSGDEKAGDEHDAKAEAFLKRILAGEDETVGEVKASAPAVAAELSRDPSVAQVQIITELGLDATKAVDPAALLAAASKLQNQQLTLLGLFGTPDSQATFPTADYTLFLEFGERAPAGQSGYKGWQPKSTNTSAWGAYIDSLG